jgi:hypothetical protein
VSSGVSGTSVLRHRHSESESAQELHKSWNWSDVNSVTRSSFEEVLDGDDGEETSGRSCRD